MKNEFLDLIGQIGDSGSVEVEKPVAPNDKVLEMLEERKKGYEKESLMSLLAGGVAEALSGDTGGEIAGYGSQLAGQRLSKADKIGDDTASAMIKAKMKKDIPTSARRYQFIPIEDEEGNIRLVTGDRATGGIKETDYMKGLAPRVGPDPVTGELSRTTKARAGGVSVPIKTQNVRKAPFTIKEEKDIQQAQSKLNSNNVFKAAKSAIVSSNKIKALLNSQEPIADAGVSTLFLRAFGEVGALSDRERRQFIGSPELERRFNSLWQKATSGTLTDADRQDLLDVAVILEDESRKVVSSEINNMSRAVSARTGIDEKRIREALSSFGQSPTVKAKKFKVDEVETGKIEGGYRFKGGDPSKKENWEKVK
jgi:hypothetical protein